MDNRFHSISTPLQVINLMFCKLLNISLCVLFYSFSSRRSLGEDCNAAGPELLHLAILRLEGTPGNSTCEYIELDDVSYRLPKPEIYKQLCHKLRVAVGKFSDGSDQRKKSLEALKNALPLVLVPLKFVSDFVLYIIEEGLTATGIDYLFGSMVVFVTGLLGWEVKGTPFRERLPRIMALEKVVSQQSDLTKRLEDAVNKIEAVLNGQKAEEPKLLKAPEGKKSLFT
ncbi:uncharacterized protein [Miscanthus floridulus]|uniref:uncharacterized protein n=1 Tax=Miscanthus floridulus TaxID=154761 RepID=UPI003459F5F9